MTWREISSREEYEGEDGIPYRRYWPIELPPLSEFDIKDDPTVFPGDLVTWKSAGMPRKSTGLVLMTRWVLADWLAFDGDAPFLIPEALVMWDDGESTNTSHPSLVVMNKGLDIPETQS